MRLVKSGVPLASLAWISRIATRGFAFVVDVGDLHLARHAFRRRRQRVVDLDVLLAVQEHERVELEPGHAEDVALRRELHDDRERRQHLEISSRRCMRARSATVAGTPAPMPRW